MNDLFTILLFLLWVNTLPPLATMACNKRWDRPLDNGISWLDGRPLLGSHKTLRGLLTSLLGGTALFPLLGWSWQIALTASVLAMAGDLFSSFLKRRGHVSSGHDVLIFDHLLESLLPSLYLAFVLKMSWWHPLAVTSTFIILASYGARLWQAMIFRPAEKNSPRLVRSPVRWREWRACHPPLARWQAMLNLTSFLSNQMLLAPFFKVIGLYEHGIKNTLDIKIIHQQFTFPDLPAVFDGLQILFLSDLHLDGVEELTDAIIQRLTDIEVDICLIGGDIRMETYGSIAPCLRHLRRLVPQINSQHGIFAVLGNHDCIEMIPDLEDCGLTMLVNDSWPIEKDGKQLWLVGLDDPHYYMVDNAKKACREVPEDAFKICLVHSPEAYRSAAAQGSNLYLCGHTHGGQICLPNGQPVLTNSRAPRYTAQGCWQYQNMQGYTSRGAGASSIPLRFNCPAEITLITLNKTER